jgi:hypothetical protein
MDPVAQALQLAKKAPHPLVIPSEARNDKTNYFFRSLSSLRHEKQARHVRMHE